MNRTHARPLHRAGLALGGAALALTGVAVATQPASAACNEVAQYVLTGENGTIRNPDGSTIAVWHRGDVINTWGAGGRQPGTTYGNVYTGSSRTFIASGDVVSAYMTYSRSFCA